MHGREVLEEILAVSALYRDRHGEWPAQVRLDASRLQALAAACSTESFPSIAAHVWLAVRDSPGVSAGGRGVVELAGSPSAANRALAEIWMGTISLAEPARISVKREFWARLAERTTERHPRQREFEPEHVLSASAMAPDRLESTDEDARRAELLFHIVYVSSFGIDGVHPKTLAITRWSYGWKPSELPELMLTLHRQDGRMVQRDAPWELLNLFPVTRSELPSAVMRLGEAMADLARELADA